MDRYSRTHLSDPDLLRSAATKAARESTATADLLADLAEIDARKLYLPEGYPSMYLYCLHQLHLSEDAACKRIAAARAARQFPAIFVALAERRLHLSGLVLLAPKLTPENAEELLAAATHKSRREIELLLAGRFPRPDRPTRVQALPAASPELLAPGPVDLSAPGRIESPSTRSKMEPLSPGRFVIEFTVDLTTYEKLRYVQALLGRENPVGEMPAVFDLALDALIPVVEKRKFAATSRPRRGAQRSSNDPRHIPAEVKRTVWARDGGRCTFTTESGRRCPATTGLEFDHIEPVARGGQATVENVRLRCKAHNQYEAERTFGAGFMCKKREEAKSARAQARAQKQAAAADPEKDVTPWLRKLGFSVSEARLAAERCESIPDASLENRIRFALRLLAPPHRTVYPTMAT